MSDAGGSFIASTLADKLVGGAGADTFEGGAGSDEITLGGGSDTLIFSSLSGIDTVKDFNPAQDVIQLAKAAMAALGAVGGLTDAEFEAGAGLAAATEATTRIFYNETSGALYYDADGSGGGAAVQLATFTTAPQLTHTQLFIV
jgi:Ca2+-binding RTX toxin-like protein